MRICDLISNPEFSFNAPFRIASYDMDADRLTVVFDSRESGDVPPDVMMRWISAVNTGDDGVLEIEYISDMRY